MRIRRMGKCYRHFIEIAEELGFHKATIYRELERNSNAHGYRPDWASQQYKLRQQHRSAKLDKEPALTLDNDIISAMEVLKGKEQ